MKFLEKIYGERNVEQTKEHTKYKHQLRETICPLRSYYTYMSLTLFQTVPLLHLSSTSQGSSSSQSIPTQLIKENRNSLKLTFPFLSQSISSADVTMSLLKKNVCKYKNKHERGSSWQTKNEIPTSFMEFSGKCNRKTLKYQRRQKG